jgi:hypothetical protein
LDAEWLRSFGHSNAQVAAHLLVDDQLHETVMYVNMILTLLYIPIPIIGVVVFGVTGKQVLGELFESDGILGGKL